MDFIADFKDVEFAIFFATNDFFYDFIFLRCDFVHLGYLIGLVYVPPLPANLEELKQRITTLCRLLLKTCCSVFGRS